MEIAATVLLAGVAGVLATVLVMMRVSREKRLQTSDKYHRLKLDLMAREIKEKEGEADRFLEACASLFHGDDLDSLCQTVMDVIHQALEADQGSLMLLDGDKHLKVVASRGLTDNTASNVHIRLGERVAGVCAAEKREFLLNGGLGEFPLFRDLEPNPLIHSSIICPVCYKDELLGVLNMSRTVTEQPFDGRDLKKAMALARQIAAAIHYQRMCKELQNHAIRLKEAYRYLQQRDEKIHF